MPQVSVTLVYGILLMHCSKGVEDLHSFRTEVCREKSLADSVISYSKSLNIIHQTSYNSATIISILTLFFTKLYFAKLIILHF